MKRSQTEHIADRDKAVAELADALATLNGGREVEAFLYDLCTPAELEALSDRWRVVALLEGGIPYREIHARTGVSVTTVGRVARFLDAGRNGYRMALERLPNTLTKDTEE
jgi:TrpR-related protein YerC/YecD